MAGCLPSRTVHQMLEMLFYPANEFADGRSRVAQPAVRRRGLYTG